MTFKKSNTIVSKLPPVAMGGEMAEKLKESEKNTAKLEAKVKSLEEALIQEKKAKNAGSSNHVLELEIENLRNENTGLMVETILEGRNLRAERSHRRKDQ